MVQKKARSSKNTYWNNKRVAVGFTMQELSEGLGVDYTRLSHYLTGQEIPPTLIAMKLCDLFDVPYDEGAAEFNKAHEQWELDRKKSKFILAEPKSINEELMKSLYGLLSYEDFKEVLLSGLSGADVLAKIYGKVDYDTYQTISKLVK